MYDWPAFNRRRYPSTRPQLLQIQLQKPSHPQLMDYYKQHSQPLHLVHLSQTRRRVEHPHRLPLPNPIQTTPRTQYPWVQLANGGAAIIHSKARMRSEDDEKCEYHPGQALFHEGSKGWTCCKKRVLEFDEFMKIPGCKTRSRHCYVGKAQKNTGDARKHVKELSTVRSDFYQTSTVVNASFYLKKIDKTVSVVEFPESGLEINLDLRTTDSKRYAATVPLFAKVDPAQCTFKILGTKLELCLAKTDGAGWPVLRSDEKHVGEIIQTGRAGRA